METFWFAVVALVFTVYIVLDGLDFGVGILYFAVARTDIERRIALRAIGPVWNGNEVWLILGGGLSFFAFPRAYASGFSGFYLALILVLWLLMLRGLAIELRSHFNHPVWTQIWDVTFSGASVMLAFVFGVAVGNLIRGVPLNADGYFFTPFWTTFLPGPDPGILDVYTLFTGLLGVALLALHGAYFLMMKTEGAVFQRSWQFAKAGSWAVFPLVLVNLFILSSLHPAFWENFSRYPVGYVLPIASTASLMAMVACSRMGKSTGAAVSSCVFILTGLGVTGWAYYPNLLISTTDPALSLTIYNSAASDYGLRVGLVWFSIGFPLVLLYTFYAYRSFWGRVTRSSVEGTDGY
ncbi:MAG: cytochrome d ubiquinol oxidase subunit II [Nitrospirales bacterium]|nr:cytochrome d ubiquinol oxidase subunit II [Nitrospira sp.]MDR4502022.1 cytochrome d ubiquinol oxidase subunit II [Nitrospirales bacterium]